MKVDALIIGSGIQGLILTRELRKQGLNVKCITNCPIGGDQTLKSQFYLHRGHFYDKVSLATTLDATYRHWVSLLQELNLHLTKDQSYIGFNSESDRKLWTSFWKSAHLTYEKATVLPDVLKQSRGVSFYKFPHILFSGEELIAKLAEDLSSSFIFGNIKEIKKIDANTQSTTLDSDGTQIPIISKYIILCAGSGNAILAEMVKAPLKKNLKMQQRSCLALTLAGDLPNISLLLPGQKIFIAPQYDHHGRVHWIYTYGIDPAVTGMPKEHDAARLKKQLNALFDFFPSLQKNAYFDIHAYNALKFESADVGDGFRPNEAFVHSLTQNIFLIWPTKLTLVFEASHEVMKRMEFSSEHLLHSNVANNLKSEQPTHLLNLKIGKQAFLKRNKPIPSDYLTNFKKNDEQHLHWL